MSKEPSTVSSQREGLATPDMYPLLYCFKPFNSGSLTDLYKHQSSKYFFDHLTGLEKTANEFFLLFFFYKNCISEDKDQRNTAGNLKETGQEFMDRGEMGRFSEENTLLQKLASGELDGLVGRVYFYSGGSSVWTVIENGNPVRYKQGPGGKYFDGKENVKYEGKKNIQEKWER